MSIYSSTVLVPKLLILILIFKFFLVVPVCSDEILYSVVFLSLHNLIEPPQNLVVCGPRHETCVTIWIGAQLGGGRFVNI